MRALIERIRRAYSAPVIEHPTERFLIAIMEHAAIERLGHPIR